jgi:hypothetical protein
MSLLGNWWMILPTTTDHQRIAQGIGAHKGEVELLYSEGVFAAKKTAEHQYNKAWRPRTA